MAGRIYISRRQSEPDLCRSLCFRFRYLPCKIFILLVIMGAGAVSNGGGRDGFFLAPVGNLVRHCEKLLWSVIFIGCEGLVQKQLPLGDLIMYIHNGPLVFKHSFCVLRRNILTTSSVRLMQVICKTCCVIFLWSSDLLLVISSDFKWK